MKPIPPGVHFQRRTPEFTAETIPNGLRKSHRTKPGVWGRIVVSEGRLAYRILRPGAAAFILDPANAGVVEPEAKHEVEPLGQVRFHVEFYR
jgi:tellurite resistance-related uncharacterized protein